MVENAAEQIQWLEMRRGSRIITLHWETDMWENATWKCAYSACTELTW